MYIGNFLHTGLFTTAIRIIFAVNGHEKILFLWTSETEHFFFPYRGRINFIDHILDKTR